MADQQRATELVKVSTTANQFQIVIVRLAKPDSRVEAYAGPLDSSRHKSIAPACQVTGNIGHDVVIAWINLHAEGISLHVHGTDSRSALPGNIQHLGIPLQAGHVIDDLRTQRHGLAGNVCLGGVDRDGNLQLPTEFLDHGHHTIDLLGEFHRVGSRPRTFPSHVQDSRSRLSQPQPLVDRLARIQELSPVRKTVRGHIDDPHQAGQVAELEDAGPQLPVGGGRSKHAVQLITPCR